MDTRIQEQHQKDFISTFFPSPPDHTNQNVVDSSQQQALFNGSSTLPLGMLGHGMQPSSNANMPLDMDLLGNLMGMQGIDTQAAMMSNQQAPYNPQVLLEQQFKLTQLQQLQQLQNQIFQQQIALISGQTGTNVPDMCPDPQREQRPLQHPGLLTPGPSSELRPQPNNEYVSPMILQYADAPQETYHNGMPQSQSHHSNPHYSHMHGSSSAPADMAFRTHSVPLSTGDLDFDISPLTSPWLGAHQQSVPPRQINKRTASPSGDEGLSRKRQSPAVRPSNPTLGMKKNTRTSSLTPLLRSTRSRRNSSVMEGDTPSPVDLSMPPPAPPSNLTTSPSVTSPKGISHNGDLKLTPVTPASIMNLGRLGLSSGLAPAQDLAPSSKDAKGRSTTRPKAGESSGSRKSAKKNLGLPPSLKPILPAGNGSSLHIGPSASNGEPQVRKTSHKAAEQKRRDSLKTTFDDLRHLLPPIPLPSDENFPDEPILPGALPPRGPPKAGGEGPNKGVSKLQLLRCGNDLIRQLKGRVERRDEEIEKLRREVKRLRIIVGDITGFDEEELDLERDLDAHEAPNSGFGRGSTGDDDADEEDD